MQCQNPDCQNIIPTERLEAQPNTKTCGLAECKRGYRNWYMRTYRNNDASRESNRTRMANYRKRKGKQ